MADQDNIDQELQEAEEELSSADESNETPPADIVAFNELRSCADLYRLYEADQLEIQPDYQRDIVWQPAEQTRFIDSLAKQLPIPSMCISLDYKTDKRQVVDGLQRMSSIIRFLSEKNWRLSKLPDIDQRISNKTVEYLKREHPEIYSRVENTTIPVTVLRCDLSKRSAPNAPTNGTTYRSGSRSDLPRYPHKTRRDPYLHSEGRWYGRSS